MKNLLLFTLVIFMLSCGNNDSTEDNELSPRQDKGTVAPEDTAGQVPGDTAYDSSDTSHVHK